MEKWLSQRRKHLGEKANLSPYIQISLFLWMKWVVIPPRPKMDRYRRPNPSLHSRRATTKPSGNKRCSFYCAWLHCCNRQATALYHHICCRNVEARMGYWVWSLCRMSRHQRRVWSCGDTLSAQAVLSEGKRVLISVATQRAVVSLGSSLIWFFVTSMTRTYSIALLGWHHSFFWMDMGADSSSKFWSISTAVKPSGVWT